MTESDRIEYKLELTPDVDLEEEAVAFLNKCEGGVLYFGIDKHGVAVGCRCGHVEDQGSTKKQHLAVCHGSF